MKKNLWTAVIACVIVAAAAGLLGLWQAFGMGSADAAVVTAGAAGWLALALAGFGTLAVCDTWSRS